MGLFNKAKNEFIDIIEWFDEAKDTLVHRFDRYQNEIKMNAKLIVRPGQKAIFVNEGQIADFFEPGTYTLTTENMPILSTLKGWKYGFNSPFKAEVYFIDITEQLDRKWGTPNPIMMRDSDFGMVRLRCRGNFSYKIGETKDLLSRFVGAGNDFKTTDIEGQIKTKIISSFSDCMGELKIPALDLVTQYDEIGDAMKNKLTDNFTSLGLALISFTLENITLPESVQEALDNRSSMGAIGDLNNYAQYQAATALKDAANNQGGAGNMMGMMMGGQLAAGLGNVLHQENRQTTQKQEEETSKCSKCRQENPKNAKFCTSCGNQLETVKLQCSKCHQPIAENAKFCSNCGASQTAVCSKCNNPLQPGIAFCPNCGTKQ